MYKYIFQIITSGFLFLFFMIIAWYEGSEIIENSIQWEYSTPFTKLFGIEIVDGSDIIWLDYFVYSIKFQPVFPILMLISAIYLALLLIIYISKYNNKLSSILIVFGLISLIGISSISKGASTIGGKFFFLVTLCSVILFIVVIIIQCFGNKKKRNISN